MQDYCTPTAIPLKRNEEKAKQELISHANCILIILKALMHYSIN